MTASTMRMAEVMYTKGQLQALFWASYIPLILTCAGSATILFLVRKEWKQNPRHITTYHRVMCGLSLYDLFAGTGALLFKSWSVPAESGLAYAAAGNAVTCSINGFFTNLVVGSMLYTASLSVYYVLKIRFECTNEQISRYAEPLFHVVPSFVTIVSGVAGIATGAFNPFDELAGFCWFSDYPPSCSNPEREDLVCIRGENSHVISRVLVTGTVGFTLVCIILCMTSIVFKVWSTERKLSRYGHGTQQRTRMTRETAKQAGLYTGCFFISFIGLVIIQVSPFQETKEHASYYFPLCLVTSILAPLQGFFNAIIYVRPRYRELTDVDGPLSFLNDISRALPFLTTKHSSRSGAKRRFQSSEDGISFAIPSEQPEQCPIQSYDDGNDVEAIIIKSTVESNDDMEATNDGSKSQSS